MTNQRYNWVNQMVKQSMHKKKRAKSRATKLIDIIDEMNLKEDTTNTMVVGKLNKLAQRIFKINKYSEDVQFVSDIIEDLIESPHHRITKLQIEMCNNLYKQYNKEIK